MTETQNTPYVVEEDAGKRAWCACGKSAKRPYCDGTHKTTNTRPVVVDIPKAKRIAWCGCLQTKTPPYCDGTHARLPG